MDEQNLEALKNIERALKSLQGSAQTALQTNTWQGAGKPLMRSYNGLYEKIRELLPDDVYVETLALHIEDGTGEQELVGQVNVAARQLYTYLREQTRESGLSGDWGDWGNFGRDMKNIGREIQEQVMGVTRNTVRRALSNIDFEIDGGGDYRNKRIEGENLSDHDLKSTDFRRAVIIDCDLSGCAMPNTDLRRVRLENSTLFGSDMRGADLRHAIINGCNLDGVNVKHGDFRHAIIHDTDMSNTNLQNASLKHTMLANVNLRGANLRDADLKHAVFYDVQMDETTIMPDGSAYAGYESLADFRVDYRTEPVPPVPPVPPKAPGEKRKIRVEIDTAVDSVDDAMEAIDAEMDALDTEMEQLDAEMAQFTGDEQPNMDEERRKVRDLRRRELEERRARIEAELAEIEASFDDE